MPCSFSVDRRSAQDSAPPPNDFEAFVSPRFFPESRSPTRLPTFPPHHSLHKTPPPSRLSAFPSTRVLLKALPANRLHASKSRCGRWRSSWLGFQAARRLAFVGLYLFLDPSSLCRSRWKGTPWTPADYGFGRRRFAIIHTSFPPAHPSDQALSAPPTTAYCP